MKYPYLKEREVIHDLHGMSVLRLADDTMAVTVFDSKTNCSFLQVINVLSDKIEEIHYESVDSSCF